MARKAKRERVARHPKGLGDQLESLEEDGIKVRPKNKRRKTAEDKETEEVDPKITAKIMKAAREQQEAIDAEDNALLRASAGNGETQPFQGLDDLNLESDSSDDEGPGRAFSDASGVWDEEPLEVSPEDEAAMAAFWNPHGMKQKTLADIILEKIKEKEQQKAEQLSGQAALPGPPPVDERVAAVYKGVGQIMRRFTTGKVPKAFKIIPTLHNWEEVLYLTEPESWSPHAVYQATRMFVSSLNARLAQRFLALVVLPHIRQDIQENKRLHFALFQAVKKAMFKPDAFFKGILLPLCRSGDCTLREAVILSSAISRTSIPVAHSGAALLRLAELPYAGTTSFFIRVLLDKKYAMPYRVVDALVDHFLRFQNEERTLPVVWHQSLLVFLQRYKHEVRKEDQAQLRKLVKTQYHYKMSPEIYRELEAARARGEAAAEEAAVRPTAVNSTKGVENPKSMPPVILREED